MTTAFATEPTTHAIDEARAAAFGQQIFSTIVSACATMLIGVGHRTGIFDTLANLPPVTSAELATHTGLQERYVRELLSGLAVSGIVEYDEKTKRFYFPPEHAASLTQAAGPNNLAALAQYPSVFSAVEPQLVEAFRIGGGIPRGLPRFQQVMREESAIVVDASLVDTTLPLVPGIVDRLRTGIDVADFGCGCGHALNVMARAFPNSRFTGFDFLDESLATARAEAAEWGLTNVRFEKVDVATIDRSGAFDLVTAFDAIHDQANPAQVLQNIAASLRTGGNFLMVDIAGSSHLEKNLESPLAVMMYTASLFHCMAVSLHQGGAGLGTMWGEELATRMLEDAGFGSIATHHVESDILNIYFVCSK